MPATLPAPGMPTRHLRPLAPNPQVQDRALQDRLIDILTELSGVALPA
jgi:hypothetical protein